MRTVLILAVCASVLAACGDEPAGKAERPEPVRTVAFFLANSPQHEETLVRCRADPGALKSKSDCMNAEEANRKVMIWGRDEALRRAGS